MAGLGDRLDRLERASARDDRSAEMTAAAEAFRRDMLRLAARLEATGDTRRDARKSPRENMAAALARGDFRTARRIVEVATRRRADEGAR